MHACIHTYIHTCIHTYIHTYIHTPVDLLQSSFHISIVLVFGDDGKLWSCTCAASHMMSNVECPRRRLHPRHARVHTLWTLIPNEVSLSRARALSLFLSPSFPPSLSSSLPLSPSLSLSLSPPAAYTCAHTEPLQHRALGASGGNSAWTPFPNKVSLPHSLPPSLTPSLPHSLSQTHAEHGKFVSQEAHPTTLRVLRHRRCNAINTVRPGRAVG